MSGPRPQEPGAGATVEGYLAEVAARLPGPAQARTGIVAELRSGLLDATDARQARRTPVPSHPRQPDLTAPRAGPAPTRLASFASQSCVIGSG
jgi:hypothetical protein